MSRENICWTCKHWEECFKYRYGNKKQEYMEKIFKQKDNWGQSIIYVEKCKNFEYEDPDLQKKSISGIHNAENEKICDIIDVVENYFE